ncbi:MAG: protein kinase, partial [Pirellulaceae bacterium]|nr:protein kinase [Pirellulaceae bacterium]
MDHRLLLLTALLRGMLSPGDVAAALGASDRADALLEGLEPSQRKALEADLARRTGSPTGQGRNLLAELGRQNLLDNSLTVHLPDDWQTVEADITIDREPAKADMTIDREPADPDVTIDPGEHRRVLLEPASDRQQDPHSITRFLAEGGLGQVFVAQDTRLGREVVLKQLQQVDNDESMGRFMREAQVTGQLEHPNIVPIYGLGWDKNDAPYYTMKYVRGRTLADLVEDYHRQKQEGSASRLQLRELLDAFLSVCNAVGYSHTREVVHRDLKPENIAVGEFGEVIVLDWGLAKLLEEPDESTGTAPLGTLQDAGQTIQGRVMGTPNYMPPEQARGEVDSIDPRADIYSLGAILFHILAGSPPRQKNPENLEQLIDQVAAGQIPTLRDLDRRAPRELDAICSHAMNTDAADRYQSVAALSDDLKHWLVDEPVSVCPEPWPKKVARWARNHKAAVTTAASIAILAMVTLAYVTAVLNVEHKKRQQANTEATAARHKAFQEQLVAVEFANQAQKDQAIAESAEQAAREQRDLARRSEAEAARQRDIARQAALESRRQLIRQHITRGMALAAEQRSFEALLWFTRAYEQDAQLQQELHPQQPPAQQQARLEEHQLRIHNILSRCPLPVHIWQPEGGAGQIRFSPTGTVLATSNGHPASPSAGDGQARLWDALTGQPLSPPLEHDQSVNQLLFHPDGTLLATAAGGPQGAGSARVWQVPSGAPAGPPIPSPARVVKVALHPGGTLLATASADGSARVWQIDSGTPASEAMVHDAPLVDIAFSPDGRRLVTAAANKVRIWDATTGNPMGPPVAHPGQLGMCRFSEDGTRVITAIDSGFFFQLGPDDLPLS